jgi:hypothetical protein
MRLDPFPRLGNSSAFLAEANYMLKRYGEAVRLWRECASRLPNLQWPHLLLAAACAQSGQLESTLLMVCARRDCQRVEPLVASRTLRRDRKQTMHHSVD